MGKKRSTRRRRRTGLDEWLLFGLLVGAGSLALIVTTVAPHRRKTIEFVARAERIEREVELLREENARLEAEITALESDPWIVERELRRRASFLRVGEHRFGELPAPARAVEDGIVDVEDR